MEQILKYVEGSNECYRTQVTTFRYDSDNCLRQQIAQKQGLFWDVVGDTIMNSVVGNIINNDRYGGICYLFPGKQNIESRFYSEEILDLLLSGKQFQEDLEYKVENSSAHGNINIKHKKELEEVVQNIELPSFDEYLSGRKEKTVPGKEKSELPGLSEYARTRNPSVEISPLSDGSSYAVSPSARSNILEYAHPLDSKIIDALDNPMVNTAIGKLVQAGYDANYGLILSTGIHINQNTYPELYEVLVECAETLHIPVPYTIISNSVPGINASAAGTDQFSFIMISSILPMVMSRDELKFVIGHECGHLALGHVIYHTAGSLIGTAGTLLPVVGRYIAQTISLPLKAWERRSEVSADRAGLMCCGDIKVAQKTLYKLQAGFLGNRDVDIDEYIRESERMLNNTLLGKYSELTQEHPILPKRMKALKYFANSELYAKCTGIEPEKDWFSQEKLNAETEKILEIM